MDRGGVNSGKDRCRTTVEQPVPSNKLNELEVQAVLEACHRAETAHPPFPTQIVLRLADEGVNLVSESAFYRNPQGGRHGRLPMSCTPALQVEATDYPYLVEDIYCWRQPLVMHSDNGAPMKSSTTQAKLYDLGFTPARRRPRVCNENPYSESLFRTVQYFPQWPKKGIENLEDACIWVHDFIVWYNQSIVTAALVTSHQISIAGVRIKLYWRNVMPSAKRQGEEIRNTGQDAHVIGHPPKIISPFVKW